VPNWPLLPVVLLLRTFLADTVFISVKLRCVGANRVVSEEPFMGSTASPGGATADVIAANPLLQKKTSPLRLAWRIVRWASYVFSVITLVMMVHRVEPPAIETSPEAAARVEEKFAEVERATLSGHEATLRLDETELNSFLGMYLNVGDRQANAVPKVSRMTVATGLPNTTGTFTAAQTTGEVEKNHSNVRDIKIQLIADRARAFVLFNMLGKDMTLQLEGRLGTTGGYIHFEPLGGQLGTMAIPQSALDAAVKQLLDSPENHEKLRLPVNISDVRIENGEFVATYR